MLLLLVGLCSVCKWCVPAEEGCEEYPTRLQAELDEEPALLAGICNGPFPLPLEMMGELAELFSHLILELLLLLLLLLLLPPLPLLL